MRCALCGRSLDRAAIFIGQLPVGPVCAKQSGLLVRARKRYGVLWVADQKLPRAAKPQRDSETLDLFEVAA